MYHKIQKEDIMTNILEKFYYDRKFKKIVN